MIYVIVGLVVLIISFILAFVSLVREHKKLEEETLVDVPEDPGDTAVLEQQADSSGDDKENIYRRLEELTKNERGQDAALPDAQNVTDSVERKAFPWEIEGQGQMSGTDQSEPSTLGEEKVGQVDNSWKEEPSGSEGKISGTISLSSARKKTQD